MPKYTTGTLKREKNCGNADFDIVLPGEPICGTSLCETSLSGIDAVVLGRPADGPVAASHVTASVPVIMKSKDKEDQDTAASASASAPVSCNRVYSSGRDCHVSGWTDLV